MTKHASPQQTPSSSKSLFFSPHRLFLCSSFVCQPRHLVNCSRTDVVLFCHFPLSKSSTFKRCYDHTSLPMCQDTQFRCNHRKKTVFVNNCINLLYSLTQQNSLVKRTTRRKSPPISQTENLSVFLARSWPVAGATNQPTTNLDALTKNLQNIKYKHAYQHVLSVRHPTASTCCLC